MWQVSARRRGSGEQNRTVGDEQGTAPDGSSTPVRSSAAIAIWPVKALADSQLQGLTLVLPSDPSRRPETRPSGSAKLNGLPVSAVGLTTRPAGEPKGDRGIKTPSWMIRGRISGGIHQHEGRPQYYRTHITINETRHDKRTGKESTSLNVCDGQSWRKAMSGAPAPALFFPFLNSPPRNSLTVPGSSLHQPADALFISQIKDFISFADITLVFVCDAFRVSADCSTPQD